MVHGPGAEGERKPLTAELTHESFGGGRGAPAPNGGVAPSPRRVPDWSKPIDASLKQVEVKLPVEAWTRCIQNLQDRTIHGSASVSFTSQASSLGPVSGALGVDVRLSASEGLYFFWDFKVSVNGESLDYHGADRKVAQGTILRVHGDQKASGIIAAMVRNAYPSGALNCSPSIPRETIKDEIEGLQRACEAYFDTLLQYLDISDEKVSLLISPREPRQLVQGHGGSGSAPLLASSSAQQRVESLLQKSDVSLSDIGGYDHVKREIERLIRLFTHEKHYDSFLVKPPRGILFAGPPGTGKTMFAKAMCNELGVNFYHVSTSDVLNAYYGESEKRLAEIFDTVETPCVIFVDELEALAAKRDHASEPSRRVLTELLRKLDGMASREGIIFLGATNKLEMLDPAITRAGRLDRTIVIDKPDTEAREQIFKVCIERHMKGTAPELKWLDSLDATALARASEGLVGADIQEVIRRIVFTMADERLLHPEGEWRPNTAHACSVIDQYHAELELKKGKER